MEFPSLPARVRLRNGLLATVERRLTPRGGPVSYEGVIDDGGVCSWDERGRDLRGYEDCDVREMVSE